MRLGPALHRCRAAPLARADTQALATRPGQLVAIRHLTPDASRAVSLTGFNPAPRTLLLTLPEP